MTKVQAAVFGIDGVELRLHADGSASGCVEDASLVDCKSRDLLGGRRDLGDGAVIKVDRHKLAAERQAVHGAGRVVHGHAVT